MGNLVGELPTSSSSSSSSNRRQWGSVLKSLVTMLKKQKSQIETLVQERQYLQEYIKRQKTRERTKTRLLRSQISQMRKTEKLEKKANDAKFEMLLGLKNKDVALIKNFNSEQQSGRDLENLLECIEDGKSRNDEVKHSILETEMQKLESAHKKIVYRDSEILALRAEKDFVWSQFNKLDSDYADLRKSKTIELEQAYEIIENLELDIKHLQASASEKNSIMVLRRCSSNKELSTSPRLKLPKS